MKNKYLCFTLIIIIFLILTSCVNRSESNDIVQLWYFELYQKGIPQLERDEAALKIIDSAKMFCEENNIPLEVHSYTLDTISWDDYILKRNLAATTGNMICIDNISNLFDLANFHADYTKLDNYNDLLDVYKGEFCIPICIEDMMYRFDNKFLELYNLFIDKQIITYSEYLNIKQKLKENGAKFELNKEEINELFDYYLYSNELLYLHDNSKITKDDTTFKVVLKKLVLDICNDIITYYDSDDFELINEGIGKGRDIIDKNSGIVFNEFFQQVKLMNPSLSIDNFEVINKTYSMISFTNRNSPSFYMHKKITNDKIYDLANYIISEDMYININENFKYLPVFKLNKSKKVLMLNDNNKYIGEAKRNQEINEFINTRYDLLLNNGDIAKEIAQNYFKNKDNINDISFFTKKLINDIAKTLSNDKLSLNNFDPNNEEINSLIDKRIDDFVFEFILYYK